MSINYTYKIINVDEQARCMEIVYDADGYSTYHIGARLPYEGEQLENVVRMYAPIGVWLESKKAVSAPPVGATGVINQADELATALASQQENTSSKVSVDGAQVL